jgi:molecular chaperone DnaJ
LRVKVKLSLQEIATGVEKKIKVRKKVTCPECGGTGAESSADFETCSTCKGTGRVMRTVNSIFGMMQTESVCPHCGGKGKIITKKCKKCGGEGVIDSSEVITINIPAGVQEGMQLSMRGYGNAAPNGGQSGDLLILIEEERHPDLIRDGNDVIYNLLLPLPTAVLGGSVEIPTIDGKVKIKIDAGTQPGKVLRLRGKGLPSLNGYGSGDLLVNIGVYIPEKLTSADKELFEKMDAESNAFKPTETAKRNFFQ